LIANVKGEFDQNVFVLDNNFITEYEQHFETYNGGQCVLVLIKIVPTTSKGDRYLKAQQYTIFKKFVNEVSQALFFKLHKKVSIIRATLRVNSFLLIFFKKNLIIFFKFK